MSKRPPVGWPDRGIIEFVNYKAQYRKNLGLALNGVSFQTQSKEKVLYIIWNTSRYKILFPTFPLQKDFIWEGSNTRYSKMILNREDVKWIRHERKEKIIFSYYVEILMPVRSWDDVCQDMFYEFGSFKEDLHLKLNLLFTVLNIYVDKYSARLVLINIRFEINQARPSLESLVWAEGCWTKGRGTGKDSCWTSHKLYSFWGRTLIVNHAFQKWVLRFYLPIGLHVG